MLDRIARSRRRRSAALIGLTSAMVMTVAAVWWTGAATGPVGLAVLVIGAALVGLTKAVFEMSTRTRTLHARLEAQEAEMASLRALLGSSTAQMTKTANRQRTRLGRLAGRVDGVATEVHELSDLVAVVQAGTARLESATAAADRERRSIKGTVVRERRARAIDFARQRSSGRMPQRLLLQMTVPRSASTQLFDALRAHPSVYVEPLAFIWQQLGFDGRRYPTAMSDLPDASVPMEVTPGIGCYLRPMQPRDQRNLDPSTGVVALEKGHPQFFGFDAAAFGRRLEHFQELSGVEVQVVYQVRRPLDVMWSFAEYKARAADWYAWLRIDEVPSFIARAFDTLEALRTVHPGIVFDFTDMSRESAALARLGRIIDPGMSEAATQDWLDVAFARADIEVAKRTGFVGIRDARRPIEGPDGAWRSSVQLIERLDAGYQSLLRSS